MMLNAMLGSMMNDDGCLAGLSCSPTLKIISSSPPLITRLTLPSNLQLVKYKKYEGKRYAAQRVEQR